MTNVEINPETAPDPAITPWVPIGPSAAGLPGAPGAPAYPTPVVNGQFVKGVGGAAVWSAIGDEDVPGRLFDRLDGHQITDWNTTTSNGWYTAVGVANAPSVNWLVGEVVSHNPAWARQTVWEFTNNPIRIFRRDLQNAVWGAWTLISTGAIGCAVAATLGQVAMPGYPQPNMVGYAVYFTPMKSGTVRIRLDANYPGNCYLQYGGGGAPGTNAGQQGTAISSNYGSHPMGAVVTGLTIGTQYWCDAACTMTTWDPFTFGPALFDVIEV